VCQSKSCWQTGFGKKIAVQFNQQFASNCANEICTICELKFAKLILGLPNDIRQKSFSSCSHIKVG